MSASTDVRCPKCHSATWKFGSDPATGLQKHRCKNLKACGHQFIPGRPPRQKKYPSFICPKCGSNMSIFKHLSDGYRLRCNRYNAPDDRRCTHKVNVPLPGRAFRVASDPIECLDGLNLAVPFHWEKMDFSRPVVSLVAYFSVLHSLPAPEIVQILHQLFNIQISHDTVTRWSHKFALNLHQNLGPVSVPYSHHKRLFVDETQFRVMGQKRWVWAGKDSRFDSLQTWFLSPRRCTEYARSTLNIAFENSPSLRKANVVTDGLHSYPSALNDLDYDTDRLHIRYVAWQPSPEILINNNRLERQWSDFKTAAASFRGFKSDLGLWSFVTRRTYRHNYFMPNKRLKGQTPAQAAQKKLPYCHDLFKLMLKFF